MKVIVVAFLLVSAPVQAQERVADGISTGLVAVNVAADAVYSWKRHCVKRFIYRNVFAVGLSELGKAFVHEDRPDHSDRKSFPSEHSFIAAANYGWSLRIGGSIALGAGAGRIVAEKHHPHDVLAGLAAGIGAGYLFPCGEK